MSYTAAVITVSDKGAAGQRTDTSGPNLCRMLAEAGWDVVYTALVPDEQAAIQTQLINCAQQGIALVLTTGGTGFSPRDVTPEATLGVIQRQTPGIPEAMRAASMAITPRGCLSRGVAGILDRTLIVNLPGSKKAAQENLEAVLDPIRHGVDMLQSAGSADCGTEAVTASLPAAQTAALGAVPAATDAGTENDMVLDASPVLPSLDRWLQEARTSPSASERGMYLFHNGVVRQTARAQVREGTQTAAVTGMDFSYDADNVRAAIAAARAMPGISYVRVWLNQGMLQVGDPIMLVLVGGDIRPHVIDALQTLVGKIKRDCVSEQEVFALDLTAPK